MNKDYICYFIAILAAFVAILTTTIMVISLTEARTQQAENQVIIEQLCHLDKTSYWCKKL